MPREELYRTFFDEQLGPYRPLLRYSEQSMRACVRELLGRVCADLGSDPEILEIGSGNGFVAALLCEALPSSRLSLLDVSPRLLDEATQNICTRCGKTPKSILGSVDDVVLDEARYQLVVCSCMIHLVRDINRAFGNISQFTVAGGYLAIITYDRCDLANQIWHRHFPGFKRIDLSRHVELDDISRSLEDTGFRADVVGRYPFSVTFADIAELKLVVDAKPFSAFAHFSDSDFRRRRNLFIDGVVERYGNGPIVSESAITLILGKKRG